MQRRVLLLLSSLLLVFASPPEDLSNYGNLYVCDTRVRLVRPKTVKDIQEVVKRYSNVQAVGEGGHWNREFICPIAQDAAAIVMTTIRPLIIYLDECSQSIWVSAGVTLWDLMVYLSNYVTPTAPRGYALGMTSFYVNQTIAGAVATGTHGSSFIHGSLSEQVLGFKVVLANGSHVEISPHSHPLYFNAFRVNVGRLGVVTHVKMAIVKEGLMKRTIEQEIPPTDALSDLRKIQEVYKATQEVPLHYEGTHLMYATNALFYKSLHELIQSAEDSPYDLDFARASRKFAKEYLKTRINAPMTLPRAEEGGRVADGVTWTIPEPFPRRPIPDEIDAFPPFLWDRHPVFGPNGNDTTETHLNWFVYPQSALPVVSTLDFYQLSVPLDTVADCLEGFIELLEELRPDPGLGFTLLCRFLPKEDGLLAVSNDKARVAIDLSDAIQFNSE